MTSEDDVRTDTDTDAPETGEFLTDQAPTAGTPAHGSSNAGINEDGGNRPDAAADAPAERDTSAR